MRATRKDNPRDEFPFGSVKYLVGLGASSLIAIASIVTASVTSRALEASLWTIAALCGAIALGIVVRWLLHRAAGPARKDLPEDGDAAESTWGARVLSAIQKERRGERPSRRERRAFSEYQRKYGPKPPAS